MEVCPAFIDETGILTGPPSNQPVYGIGVLLVPDTRAITDSFYRLHYNFIRDRATERKRLRKEVNESGTLLSPSQVDGLMWSSSHHEYKFADVTLHNIRQYLDILNLYFSFPDLEFHALVMDRLDPKASLARWHNDDWEAYAYLAKDLLEQRLTRDVFAIVDLQGEPNRAAVHLEDVLCEAPFVKGCLRATSDMSIYLQLVDVLLGCVQFDVKNQAGYYDFSSKRGRAKRHLVASLKRHLKSRRPLLRSYRSHRAWDSPSAFSITRGTW